MLPLLNIYSPLSTELTWIIAGLFLIIFAAILIVIVASKLQGG